jgi:hypothetical protein
LGLFALADRNSGRDLGSLFPVMIDCHASGRAAGEGADEGRGLDIETVEERHGGPFKGLHGRYVTRMTVHALQRAGESRHAA